MPLYIYQNKETLETREIYQSMSEKHEYFGEEGEPKGDWVRVFTVPNAAIDSQVNIDSASDFVNKTGNKKGTIGDIVKLSEELSEKRAERTGEDPVKRKYFDNYSKDRRGIKHPKDKPKKIDREGVSVEF